MAYGVLNLTHRPTADGATPAAGFASAVVRGDTFALELAFWTDPDAETGPLAVTGTVIAQIRAERLPGSTAGAALASFTTAVSGAGNNIVTLSLTAAQTLGLPSAWVWDVQADNGGVVTTWMGGKGRTLDDVSRAA